MRLSSQTLTCCVIPSPWSQALMWAWSSCLLLSAHCFSWLGLWGVFWWASIGLSSFLIFHCSSQILVWHSIPVGAEAQPSPFPPYLSFFFQLDQFAPTSSWACFVASQCLDWHKGFGGRVPGLGASCAIRHLMSMNLDVSFFRELLATPSPGRRLFYLVGECNWFTVGRMSMETITCRSSSLRLLGWVWIMKAGQAGPNLCTSGWDEDNGLCYRCEMRRNDRRLA